MNRSKTFKEYVLSRQHSRQNPFNFDSIRDIKVYLAEYKDGTYSGSGWSYQELLDFRPIRDIDTIFPEEVLFSKICKVLFLEDWKPEDEE